MNKDYVTRNEFNSQMAKSERFDVLFDVASPDHLHINGTSYTSGVYSGTSVNLDVSKYKRLRCLYGITGAGMGTLEVDLQTPLNNEYVSQNVYQLSFQNSSVFNRWAKVSVNLAKTVLSFTGGTLTMGGSTDTYMWLFKIEGVY